MFNAYLLTFESTKRENKLREQVGEGYRERGRHRNVSRLQARSAQHRAREFEGITENLREYSLKTYKYLVPHQITRRLQIYSLVIHAWIYFCHDDWNVIFKSFISSIRRSFLFTLFFFTHLFSYLFIFIASIVLPTILINRWSSITDIIYFDFQIYPNMASALYTHTLFCSLL